MILLYSHQKGGVGKSTLAINHAYFKGCSIIDLDSQNSSMLFNQLRKMNDMKSIECFTADTVDEFKELVKDYKSNKENMIIIDSGGYDSEINRLALISADIIITPVGASQIELFGLQKFRNILNDASDATGTNVKTHVLINNVDSRSKKKISELREYIEKNEKYFNLLESVIHTRVDFKNAYGDGLTVKELDKESKATQEIKSLTSIINYANLLKKENIENENAQKYIEILENKSKKLKNLTEDLIEASKISSGNETVNLQKLNFAEMILQANGEFAEKYESKDLKLISKIEKEGISAQLDSKKMWRVLENIYNNAYKHSLEGTRIYVNVEQNDKIVFTMKNISKEELNITPEELMERFVRGDKSRTSGGNGLRSFNS